MNMKCLYCDLELENPKARFCSPTHKMSFRREGKTIPTNEIEGPKKEYGMGEDPEIYYQDEITTDIELLLARIFEDYEADNPGFKCKPYMRRGMRILTMWERMKIKQYIDRDILEEMVGDVDGATALGKVPEIIIGSDPATGVDLFVPEFTPGFCIKCRAKRSVKTMTYDDADGNSFTEDLCKKHVEELEKFLKR